VRLDDLAISHFTSPSLHRHQPQAVPIAVFGKQLDALPGVLQSVLHAHVITWKPVEMK